MKPAAARRSASCCPMPCTFIGAPSTAWSRSCASTRAAAGPTWATGRLRGGQRHQAATGSPARSPTSSTPISIPTRTRPSCAASSFSCAADSSNATSTPRGPTRRSSTARVPRALPWAVLLRPFGARRAIRPVRPALRPGRKARPAGDASGIGTREGWARRLSERGFALKGHRLVRCRRPVQPAEGSA
jgi:hypothetical protein